MREFMKLIEGLSEDTKRQKSPEATPSATEYKDADAFDGPTIDLDTGASKGQLSAPVSGSVPAAPGAGGQRPGQVARGAGQKAMKAGLDGQSLNYLGTLMGSGLTDRLSNADAALNVGGPGEPQLQIGQDGPLGLEYQGDEPLGLGYDGDGDEGDGAFNALVAPTPENIEEILGQAIANTTDENPNMVAFNPEWTMVSDLPGYMQTQIRALGRMVFEPFTDTPIEDINVMAAPFTNSKRDLDMMAHWITRYGIRDDEAELIFGDIMPGYSAQTQIWNAEGYTFMLVKDQAGGYIYSWPGGRGVHIDQDAPVPQLRESDEEPEDDANEECVEEAAEPNDDAREANLEAAKEVFDAQDGADGTALNEGVTKFKDDDGRWYVQTSRNGHISTTHGPFAEDEVQAVYDSLASEDNDPLNGDGSPWAGFNEAVEAPTTRADDLAHILGQVHVHDALSNPWGIPFVEGDETMAAVNALTEAKTQAPAVETNPEILTEAQKFARLAGIGVKSKPRQQSPEAAALAAEMAALAGIRR